MAEAAQTYSYKVGDIEVIAVADGSRTAPVAEGFVAQRAVRRSEGQPQRVRHAEGPVHDDLHPDRHHAPAARPFSSTPAWASALPPSRARPSASWCATSPPSGSSRATSTSWSISHFHGDHVNGLVTPDGSAAFPNAEITVPEVEWKFWMNDDEMARAPQGRMEDLFKNNRRVFNPFKDRVKTQRLGQGSRARRHRQGTPGHSIGHTSYVVSSAARASF